MALFLNLVILAALIAAFAWWYYRGRHMGAFKPAFGSAPEIPKAKPQGAMPMLKMPTAKGWAPGEKPIAAPGLKVTPFATNLKHPRWAYVLPNGDVLVAESSSLPSTVSNIRDYAMNRVMSRAGATRPSANQITLLRDADGDGVPEIREVFLKDLSQPFGMALVGDQLYIGNTDSVMAFPYETGQTRITAPGRKLMEMKPGGHWTRNLLANADGTKLYVAVGSQSNIGENGLEAEEGRACIFELDLVTEKHREFAGGLRNPVGMAWEPTNGLLWTVVNERDGLGDETPPDYLTSVKDGGFYGWPFSYWGQTVDDRVPQNPAKVASASAPDYALGGHTASLGLCWLPENTLPGLPAGMVIGQHGSWNRSKLSGYKFILVPFADGHPQGAPIDLLTGFLADDEKFSRGRPVGVALAKDGALLAVDDVGDAVWRVTAG
ncbi:MULTISPECIES: sorbosone dehydrogenase family protein [Devosia]|jgi:glucose/arabinose dehydrogenase|uniref:Sorbosone dehydrogenase family protein n=1 Tax=Devosia litorisediminis TaxID=2829817 RepID=A0A942E9X5_9HYPH|nr:MULTISPECIES: sorbosone dehydrogenase family protein [Devosia]MBS3847504.1 sorbosone dehydrogenase family protein [Devosia litorisediminis]MCZ4347135.1 sorbosone dehydrogenase family protein [Devosia neptuniae]|tara:strand:- start:5743 stop:7047 length:1305 start_codon:yes stop_codon:yes gene_type:complete